MKASFPVFVSGFLVLILSGKMGHSFKKDDHQKLNPKKSSLRHNLRSMMSIKKGTMNIFVHDEHKKGHNKRCREDDIVDCHRNRKKMFVCHYNGRQYQTICINKNTGLNGHYFERHKKNYCGECIHDVFRRNSYVQNIPPVFGTEEVEASNGEVLLVSGNVTFIDTGIIALAASSNTIASVACQKGLDSGPQILIEFNREVSTEGLAAMFPLSSLLVVDEQTYGSCNYDEGGNDFSNDGFILVSKVEKVGNFVSVTGAALSFNHLFKEKSLFYQNKRTTRNLLGASITGSFETTVPSEEEDPEALFRITTNSALEVSASVETIRDYWRLFRSTGDGLFDTEWDPYIDYAIKFEWGAKLSNEFKFALAVSTELAAEEKLPKKDFNFISTPIYGVKLPKYLTTPLDKVLPGLKIKPECGLNLVVPITLAVDEFKLTAELSLTATYEFDTGDKSATFSLKGPPHSLNFDFSPPSNIKPVTSEDPSFDAESGLEIEVEVSSFGGIKPQVELSSLGLGEASIGFKAGLSLGATFKSPPYEPVPVEEGLPLEIWCDACHLLELSASIDAKDPFFQRRIGFLDKEPKVIELDEFSLSINLAKLCLLDSGETCGDKCCGVGGTCFVDGEKATCCNNLESECCAQTDCDPGNVCESMQCVPDTCTVQGDIECCGDENCASEEVCKDHTCTPDVCNTENDGVQCCIDEDCRDTSRYKCESEICVRKDCDHTSGDVECCIDSDCPDGEAGIFICTSNICIERGNPRFTLTWYGEDDLDIHVVTPGNAEIWYGATYDSASKGKLDHDDIPLSENGGNPDKALGLYVENVVFPLDGTAPRGTYKYFAVQFNQVLAADEFTLKVFLNDEEQATYTSVLLPNQRTPEFTFVY